MSIKHIPLTADQEKVINGLALAMTIAGPLAVLAGLTELGVGILQQSIIDVPDGENKMINIAMTLGCGSLGFIFKVALGIWLITGARAFKAIVTSDDDDQAYLEIGLSKLRNVFVTKVVVIFMMVIGALAVIALVAGVAAIFASIS